MFGLFKKKSRREVLLGKYTQLMQESHKLSTVDRKEADRKYAEAQAVQETLDQLEKENKSSDV